MTSANFQSGWGKDWRGMKLHTVGEYTGAQWCSTQVELHVKNIEIDGRDPKERCERSSVSALWEKQQTLPTVRGVRELDSREAPVKRLDLPGRGCRGGQESDWLLSYCSIKRHEIRVGGVWKENYHRRHDLDYNLTRADLKWKVVVFFNQMILKMYWLNIKNIYNWDSDFSTHF